MKVDPFIEVEKPAGRNVDKACRLLDDKSAHYDGRIRAPPRELTDARLHE